MPSNPGNLQGETVTALDFLCITGIAMLATVLLASMTGCSQPTGGPAPIGIQNMLRLDLLPFFKKDAQVHYEGSIDKLGGNADWDWWLYQDDRGEWVLMDVDGPGCIYNFVQHRYPTSPEPTFRFYFDGASEPQFTIKQSEFGKKAPLVEPLAAIFQGPDAHGAGPIWVIRSFVPMPFARSCKVTSSVRLEGNNKAKLGGGWGHIQYHTYPTAEGVTTFTGNEDYSALMAMWQAAGQPVDTFHGGKLPADPKPAHGNVPHAGQVQLAPNKPALLLEQSGAGSISAIKLKVDSLTPADLENIWITLTWDDQAAPAVHCPIGAFFGNEFGYNDLRFLTHGSNTDGTFYNYFPMPYWRKARIELSLQAGEAARGVHFEIQHKPAAAQSYPEQACGYFQATPYIRKTSHDVFTAIGAMRGRGHMVAGQVSARGSTFACEGDICGQMDGMHTPRVESDGSESWVCYGWGFTRPPQTNPSSGYDGVDDKLWSMMRLCTGDWYPFLNGMTLGVETGGDMSGTLFYYGRPEVGMTLTDTLDVGNVESESRHEYKVEGEQAAPAVTSVYEGFNLEGIIDAGRAFTGSSSFTLAVDPANDGVRLRRRSDQAQGRQRARVFVDGKEVTERTWYWADRNPHKRWLDDEFHIPRSYTRGKSRLSIEIKPLPSDGKTNWNEYYYWAFSIK